MVFNIAINLYSLMDLDLFSLFTIDAHILIFDYVSILN